MTLFRHLSHGRFLALLMFLFLIECLILAFNVFDRKDWLLENVLVVVMLLFLAVSWKKFPFSRISYSMIFIWLYTSWALITHTQRFLTISGSPP